jgi:hypothetical protein
LEETFKLALADPPAGTLTLKWSNEVVNPDMGETEAENVTVPVNPFKLVTVIFEEVEWDARKLRDVGLANRVNVGFVEELPVIVKLSPL